MAIIQPFLSSHLRFPSGDVMPEAAAAPSRPEGETQLIRSRDIAELLN